MGVDVERTLRVAVAVGASDLHLTAGAPPVVRVRGEIQSLADFESLTPEDIRTVFEVLAPD